MADFTIVRKYSRELVLATMEKREPAPLPEGISLDELIEISEKGHMQYLFMNSLLKVNSDPEKAEYMKKELTMSTYLTFMQVMYAQKISELFEQEGIRHQLLKGTVTKKLYPMPEMREMGDIDLVVYDESLDKAAQILEDLGFTNKGMDKHHMVFFKNPGIAVEVHWCLFDKNAGHAQFVYFKDNFRARLSEGRKYTYEFGIEDFYVYMIAHMAKHFFETGCGIRNLLDIYVYAGRYYDEMDASYLSAELKKCGIYDFEKNMREMAYIWLEDRSCSELYENLFAYMVDSGIYGKSENGVWSQLAKETAGGKKHRKLYYYFPSISFMQEKYPWLRKAPFLLPVGWLMRAASGVLSDESRRHKDKIEETSKEQIEQMLDIYHRLNLNFRRQ